MSLGNYALHPLINARTVTGLKNGYYHETHPIDQDVKKVMKDMLVEKYNDLSK